MVSSLQEESRKDIVVAAQKRQLKVEDALRKRSAK